MKILMLNYEFPPIGGGGGQACQALLQQYADRPDLEVDVLTSAPGPGVLTEPMGRNVLIFKVGIRKRHLHFWRRTEIVEWLRKAGQWHRRFLKDANYDLVHAFFGFPTGWLCYRTRRQTPYVISLRGSDVPGANARLQLDYKILGPLVFKPIWRHAAALVACSEGLKARALRFLPSARIEVIPNGVDLEAFHPDPGGPAGNPLRLLTVGRLSITKRLPLLMEAVVQLRSQGCDVHLTIVGAGPLEAELRGRLSEANLRRAITILGGRERGEMPALYRRHDVYVSASMQEGMSNAMLEAMASGLPIVTTRCEGVDELIADNGLVVDDPRRETLGAAIQRLARDPAARQAMSAAARRQAERFGWDRVAEAYLQLYARVK